MPFRVWRARLRAARFGWLRVPTARSLAAGVGGLVLEGILACVRGRVQPAVGGGAPLLLRPAGLAAPFSLASRCRPSHPLALF